MLVTQPRQYLTPTAWKLTTVMLQRENLAEKKLIFDIKWRGTHFIGTPTMFSDVVAGLVKRYILIKFKDCSIKYLKFCIK